MNKKVVIIIVSIVAAVVIGVVFYSHLMRPPVEVSEKLESLEDSERQNTVLIENFSYSPQELTISAGETVTWTNKDSVKHNVVSNNGSELFSDLLGLNETYSHTFNQIGEYSYYCTPHPYMTGKIVVQ